MLAPVSAHNYERYAQAAARYRPAQVRILFIQESPPYARERHFYFTDVKAHDGFWVNLMRFLYGEQFGEDTAAARARKDEWLKRFQADGYWTIDAAHEPIAKNEEKDRIAILCGLAPERIREVRTIAPEQIVLVKKSVYEGLAEPMRAAGLPVINAAAVPYPGRGQEFRFAKTLRDLVNSGGLQL